MTEVFRRYPEATPPEDRKGSPACAVAHPDAGGPCSAPAVGEVWSIPFCEAHGLEAECAADQEIGETVGRELDAISEAETQRWPNNKHLLKALGPVGLVPYYDHEEHERLMHEAYPSATCRIDPETVAFDYDGDYAGDGPVDWWSASRELIVRYVREADELGLSSLRDDLELIRERATAQQMLAIEDYERRYGVPLRAEIAKRKEASG